MKVQKNYGDVQLIPARKQRWVSKDSPLVIGGVAGVACSFWIQSPGLGIAIAAALAVAEGLRIRRRVKLKSRRPAEWSQALAALGVEGLSLREMKYLWSVFELKYRSNSLGREI